MIYGYSRVSTKNQMRDGNSLESQERLLREKGAVKIYSDAITGTKVERPQLDELRAVLQEGDTMMVTKLDRVARSAVQGMKLIDELLQKGVIVHILNMGILDNTPTGKLTRNIFLAFAEFERDMIVERTQEGKAIAKQNPSYKEGRPRVDQHKLDHAVFLHEVKKLSLTRAAEKAGISRSTLVRSLRENRK